MSHATSGSHILVEEGAGLSAPRERLSRPQHIRSACLAQPSPAPRLHAER